MLKLDVVSFTTDLYSHMLRCPTNLGYHRVLYTEMYALTVKKTLIEASWFSSIQSPGTYFTYLKMTWDDSPFFLYFRVRPRKKNQVRKSPGFLDTITCQYPSKLLTTIFSSFFSSMRKEPREKSQQKNDPLCTDQGSTYPVNQARGVCP